MFRKLFKLINKISRSFGFEIQHNSSKATINKLLSGGAGADIFNIVMAGAIPSAANTILDFQSGTDLIQLNGLGAAFGIGNLTLSGNNIAIGSSVIATLTGVETSSLTTANFKFA